MSFIRQTLEEGILIVTLDRADKLNALNQQVLVELDVILEKFAAEKEIKAMILTGEGKAFCAGADINRLAECNVKSGYEFACFGQNIFRKLETIGKPSLAAINGFAFGGGCELAMSATFRFASTVAQFGQPEVKLGVIPGYGGTQRLARLVGKGRALDLCLSGRFIDAQTALNWGLVTAVHTPELLLSESINYLKKIVSMAPLAVKAAIETIDHGYDLSLTDALHLEAIQFAATCGTEDKAEGVQAFLEKRQANFKGE